MKNIKYFLQFLFIGCLLILFKIVRLKFSRIIASKLLSTFGPFFRSKKSIEQNISFVFQESDKEFKKNSINKDICSSNKESAYVYSNGWHIKAVYSVLIGFIFAASTIWNSNLMFLQSYSWIIGAFVAGVAYYLLAKD